MNKFTGLWHRYRDQPTFQILLVLLAFALIQFICLFVFYNGFLHSFSDITSRFTNEKIPIFTDVPYHSFSILFSSLLNPFFLSGLLVIYLPFFVNRKKYSTLSIPINERIIITVCALVLSWELCTYQYNYYLDSAFYADRLILVLLSLVLFRFPIFTPLFIAFAFVYRSQFNYPLEGFMLIDKRILFDVLIMFTVVFNLRHFVPSFKTPFLFFVLCIMAGNYFYSGMAKVFISPHGYEWFVYNRPADLFLNVHYRGWMAGVNEESISSIYSFLDNYGQVFQFIVFLTECAGLFLLRSRKFALVILSSLFFMHVGIFIFGSMIFWKWMALDLLMIFILFRMKFDLQKQLFTKKLFLSSVVVVILSFFWLKPARIAWADSPYTLYFTYETIDEKGTVYEYPKNEMDPYQQWIQYDRFLFLVNEKCLNVSGFGYTSDLLLSQRIKEIGVEQILSLEKKEGINFFDEEKRNGYNEFIRTYFTNRNKRLGNLFLPSVFHAPHHIYNSVSGNVWDGTIPVKKFRTIFNRVYTENGRKVIITKKVVNEVEIPF